MRTFTALIMLIGIFASSCEDSITSFHPEITEGFSIKMGDTTVLSHTEIDYYDMSSHLIYLKDTNAFIYHLSGLDTFQVCADGEEIYTGITFPPYMCSLPIGVTIPLPPTFYPKFIIPIEYSHPFLTEHDPRIDPRIIQALEFNNQYRKGLSCDINSIKYRSDNSVTVELQLSNNDNENYYYLDPDKMGISLFHYYTNGLYLRDTVNKTYYHHQIQSQQPEPWNAWQLEWLSVIQAHESITISIRYDAFDHLPLNQAQASFIYPGLHSQVERKDLEQEYGRLWLGRLIVEKYIYLE